MNVIKCIDLSSHWCCVIAKWELFVLMLGCVVALIMRLAEAPWPGVLFLSVFVLLTSVYLTLAYVEQQGQHVKVDFVLTRVKKKVRYILSIISSFLSTAMCFFFAWATWKYAAVSWTAGERMDGAPFYPIYPAKILLAIGVTALFLQLIVNFIKAIQSSQSSDASSKNAVNPETREKGNETP